MVGHAWRLCQIHVSCPVCLRRPHFFLRKKKWGKEKRSLKRREGLDLVWWHAGLGAPGTRRASSKLRVALSEWVWGHSGVQSEEKPVPKRPTDNGSPHHSGWGDSMPLGLAPQRDDVRTGTSAFRIGPPKRRFAGAKPLRWRVRTSTRASRLRTCNVPNEAPRGPERARFFCLLFLARAKKRWSPKAKGQGVKSCHPSLDRAKTGHPKRP